MMAPLTPIPPYSAGNHKLDPYSTNTQKNQKKKENKIGDNNTIDITPAPDATGDDTPNASALDSGSTDSNNPYSLRNCKFAPYSTTTMKNQKNKENKIDDKDTFGPPPAPDAPWDDTPNYSSQYFGSTESYLPYSLRNFN